MFALVTCTTAHHAVYLWSQKGKKGCVPEPQLPPSEPKLPKLPKPTLKPAKNPFLDKLLG